jgi:hypothetical protein
MNSGSLVLPLQLEDDRNDLLGSKLVLNFVTLAFQFDLLLQISAPRPKSIGVDVAMVWIG